jgi:adenylate kinase family enzyme
MKRILIIGSSGAGKSTLSRKLGATTGLEVVHLDRIFWNAGWVETPKDEWKQKVEAVLQGDSWIMDGNFSGTLEMRIAACDTVVFLDLPRTICVYRILKRVAFYRKGARPDMADGCDERFDWEFIKWVWNYPLRSKPKVEDLLQRFQNTKRIFRLTSNREVEIFLDEINKNRAVKL